MINRFFVQLLKAANGYGSDKQQLRIQVEWDETLLLFQATYHKYDDIVRIHNYQMRYAVPHSRLLNSRDSFTIRNFPRPPISLPRDAYF